MKTKMFLFVAIIATIMTSCGSSKKSQNDQMMMMMMQMAKFGNDLMVNAMDNEYIKSLLDKITDESSNLTSGQIRMLLLDALDSIED